jgi:hypothetical protein
MSYSNDLLYQTKDSNKARFQTIWTINAGIAYKIYLCHLVLYSD